MHSDLKAVRVSRQLLNDIFEPSSRTTFWSANPANLWSATLASLACSTLRRPFSFPPLTTESLKALHGGWLSNCTCHPTTVTQSTVKSPIFGHMGWRFMLVSTVLLLLYGYSWCHWLFTQEMVTKEVPYSHIIYKTGCTRPTCYPARELPIKPAAVDSESSLFPLWEICESCWETIPTNRIPIEECVLRLEHQIQSRQ